MIMTIFNPFKKRDEQKIQRTVAKSSRRSHDILNEVQVDIARVQNTMRESKMKHIRELEMADSQLDDISKKIARVTGFKPEVRSKK